MAGLSLLICAALSWIADQFKVIFSGFHVNAVGRFDYGILKHQFKPSGAKMDKIVLHVEGMKCGGCESLVKSTLESVEGINAAQADHKLKQVEIEFDPALIAVEQLKEIIAGQGYTVTN
jgi:copper chaperone